MSKELTVPAITVITDEQWALVKRTLMDTDSVKFSDDEFKLFVNQAKRTGLDPFTRQIYATKTGGKMTVQATIDGLRLIAQRSGEYQGQTRPIWFDDEGKEYRVWPKKKGYPYACEVGVYKAGFKEPLYGMAIFEEYVAKHKDYKTNEIKVGYMWQKMPALMIAKVAEALALRKAFPNDLSGLYSSEEIPQTEDQNLREVSNEVEQKGSISKSSNYQAATNNGSRGNTKKSQVSDKVSGNNPTSDKLVNKENATETTIGTQEVKGTPVESNNAEPERHPDKSKINISKEQAEFLYKVGYKFGHNKQEITEVVHKITNKDKLSMVNNAEFELVLQELERTKKG